ncbi:helix-turn-helix transcriptional regulator [Paenibacillus lentus]|uniref:WYL domain-containing protein n=1 Tax=Paenibacillus lentus TaxID=1338368 RepID=A0A3Q8S614_9BACL|nr:WYL domain-containing protein [Paenibacillus lentus]AZK48020.1 WYL domain-containing protein [Paenibacillus lentus]
MKKIDRMLAIILALQQRPETAQSLADRLEVSRRTVLRDMQALSEMGVPLYAESGYGGGYRLMDGYTVPPLQLDAEEAMTVLLALEGMAKYADGPFQRARWTVMDKIRSVLPEGMLSEVSPLLSRVDLEVPDRRYKTPFLATLMYSAAQDEWLRIYYRSQNHCRYLEVKPLRIFAAYGFWYCEAYSVQHQEKRTFRVDRMDEVQRICKPSEAAEVAYSAEKADTDDRSEVIHVRVKLTYKGALLVEQDHHMGHHVKQVEDETWEVDFDCPRTEWNWAVSLFYSLGMDAEVLEPQRLRADILERARQVVERYDTSSHCLY